MQTKTRQIRISLTLALASLWAATALGAETSPAFDFGISYTNEFVSVIEGGTSDGKGSGYADQLYIGGKLNLAQLWGWQGAEIRLDISNRSGENVAAQNIGNSTSLQEIYGGQGLRLANFTLHKTWAEGKFMWEGGRSVANIHFLGSDLCQYFQLNAACGNPTYIFRNSGFTWWPVSSWATHVKWWFQPQFYAHIGAYEVNPTLAEDGKNGTQWGSDDSTGWITPFALGYKKNAEQRPGFYEVGGWYDSSDYRDPLVDAQGSPALSSGNAYAELDGRSGFFVRFQQNLTSASDKQGLFAFGAYLRGLEGQLEQEDFIKLGFVQKGLFFHSRQDSLAFVYTRQNYSSDTMENLRLARALAGGSGTPADSQTMMELSYGIQVSPQLKIQPNIQYIINPDQQTDPSRLEDLDNVWAIGLRIDWNIKDSLSALF